MTRQKSPIAVDGPDRQRLQLLGQFTQYDVAHDGRAVWTYDSAVDTYRHLTLPDSPDQDDGDASGTPDEPEASAAGLTPVDLARRALAALDPTTRVTVGSDVEVAGRGAYELRLEPRTSDTLVGVVSLAIDADTGMALRVSVTARGASEPALAVGFGALDIGPVPAERFRLTPPEGATVEELASPSDLALSGRDHRERPTGWTAVPDPETQMSRAPDVVSEVVGEGWAAILVLPASDASVRAEEEATLEGILGELTTPVEGGRVLATGLLSVLLADDGRVLVGAVPVDALLEAAR